MKKVKLAIVGFGNVAKGFLEALKEMDAFYQSEYGLQFVVTAIVSNRFGCVYNPQGLALDQLIHAENLAEIKGVDHKDWNAIAMIHQSESDAVLELSSTDLLTGNPATLHIQEALLSGKNVVTSNKGPVALNFADLQKLAVQNHLKIGYEATVMSGTPALNLGTELLKHNGITSVKGILNGTCNYILSEMEKGLEFEEALKLAQEYGYAETDPSGDVEGLDTAGKVSILSKIIFNHTLPPDKFEYQGITRISKKDIEDGLKENKRWKLIGEVKLVENEVRASVKPELLPMSNPLANVMGAANAIQYETRLLGKVTLVGAGAGRLETAAGILQDLISIYR